MASSVERQALILKNLHTNGKVVVAELSELLRVSEVTVRNDLEQLSQKGMLVRTHGGAVKSDLLVHDIPLYEKTTKHQNQKERIATVAAALVDDGEVITIDSGSTTASPRKSADRDERTSLTAARSTSVLPSTKRVTA